MLVGGSNVNLISFVAWLKLPGTTLYHIVAFQLLQFMYRKLGKFRC